MFKRIVFAAAIAAPVFGLTGPATAASDFYAGKTITITIGYGFGGTYGKYARLLADGMQRHIPGSPNIIVKSMPGAGGMKATNFAYNAMPRDGLDLLMPPDTAVVAQLMRPEKMKFDVRKFTWLGSSNVTNIILVARTDTGVRSVADLRTKDIVIGVRSVADLRTKDIVIGAVGTGSNSFLSPKLLKGLLGWKAKIITGYKGSSKTILAVEQGEVQAAAFNWLTWDSKVPHWFRDGYARPIVQLGMWKDPAHPDLTLANDIVAPADKPLVDFLSTAGALGRGLVTPPGVARDKIAVLTKAFADTVADPEYIATAKKRRLRVVATSGPAIQKIVNDTFAKIDDTVIQRARKLIFETK